MRPAISAGGCFLACVVAASTLAGPKVDYDRTADFSKYRTYQWKVGSPASSDHVQDRIEQAIDERLQASGLSRLDRGGDLIVVIHISTSDGTPVRAEDFGYGGWPGWGGWNEWGTSTVEVNRIPDGTLIVDLVDAASNKLVWRGIASGKIEQSSDKTDRQIGKKIGRLFRQFPPSKGS